MFAVGVRCVSHRHELESDIHFFFGLKLSKKLRGHGIESARLKLVAQIKKSAVNSHKRQKSRGMIDDFKKGRKWVLGGLWDDGSVWGVESRVFVSMQPSKVREAPVRIQVSKEETPGLCPQFRYDRAVAPSRWIIMGKNKHPQPVNWATFDKIP